MVTFSAGEIVFIPFPFPDLSQAKLRPALIIAPYISDDFILCQITSKSYSDSYAIELRQSDFSQGGLIQLSYVRPGKIFTAHSSLIISKAGKIESKIMSKIIETIITILRNDK